MVFGFYKFQLVVETVLTFYIKKRERQGEPFRNRTRLLLLRMQICCHPSGGAAACCCARVLLYCALPPHPTEWLPVYTRSVHLVILRYVLPGTRTLFVQKCFFDRRKDNTGFLLFIFRMRLFFTSQNKFIRVLPAAPRAVRPYYYTQERGYLVFINTTKKANLLLLSPTTAVLLYTSLPFLPGFCFGKGA